MRMRARLFWEEESGRDESELSIDFFYDARTTHECVLSMLPRAARGMSCKPTERQVKGENHSGEESELVSVEKEETE